MNLTYQDFFKRLLPLLVQTGITIGLIVVAWFILLMLPMMDAIVIPLEFSFSDLVRTAIYTVIGIIIVNFALRMEMELRLILTAFPQGATIIKLILLSFVVLLAYSAYRPLVLPYMPDLEWIYHLLFFGLFIAVLVVLGLMIFNNVGQLSTLIAPGKAVSFNLLPITCPSCGNKNREGSSFCSFCGKQLPEKSLCKHCDSVLEEGINTCPSCGEKAVAVSNKKPNSDFAVEEVTSGGPVCAACGMELEEQSGLCVYCGFSVEKPSGEDFKEQDPDPAEPVSPRCSSCGMKLKEEARFCRYCGAIVESPVAEATTMEPFAGAVSYAVLSCSSCGKELKEDAKFCTYCGAAAR